MYICRTPENERKVIDYIERRIAEMESEKKPKKKGFEPFTVPPIKIENEAGVFNM